LISGGINNVEHHGKKEITDQNREGRVYYRLSCGSTNTDCPFACGQAFMAANEYNEYSETECF
jgi:hypothetical protein